MAPTRVEIVSLDHLVLTVRDVEATLAFYERIGFEPVSFGGNLVEIAVESPLWPDTRSRT